MEAVGFSVGTETFVQVLARVGSGGRQIRLSSSIRAEMHGVLAKRLGDRT